MGIRIGFIGTGQFSHSFIPLWQAHPGVDEVVATELDAARLAAAAERHGIATTYPDMDALLDSDVDAVAVFTNRWSHGPIALKALQAGKHVYSTVPMGMTVDELRAITDEVKKTGLTYMMGETGYYYPSSVYCRQKLQEGAFGRVFYSESDYVHDMDNGFYAAYQYAHPDDWKEVASFPPMHYPTHAVGNVLSVTGRHAVAVSCIGIPDDRGDGVFDKEVSRFDNDISNATALFRLDDGSAMRTNEFRRVGCPSHPNESRLRVFGTEGSYEMLTASAVWQTRKDGEDVTAEVTPRRVPDVNDPSVADIDPALREAFLSGMSPAHEPISHRLPEEFKGLHNGHLGSHHYLADDFVRAVTSGDLPPVNAWVAARYTMPGIIAHQSALQGGTQLEIPDLGDAPA